MKTSRFEQFFLDLESKFGLQIAWSSKLFYWGSVTYLKYKITKNQK